jgi:hypothetical protein
MLTFPVDLMVQKMTTIERWHGMMKDSLGVRGLSEESYSSLLIFGYRSSLEALLVGIRDTRCSKYMAALAKLH